MATAARPRRVRALSGAALISLLVATVGVLVATTGQALASTQTIADPIGDDCPNVCAVGPLPQGDIITAGAEYTNGIIAFGLDVLRPADPFTDPNWNNIGTGPEWDIGVTNATVGLGAIDYYVLMGLVGDNLRASVWQANGSLLCSATPTLIGGGYQVSFPASCIGSPPQFFWDAEMGYAVGPGVQNMTFDIAPNEVLVGGVLRSVLTGPVTAGAAGPPGAGYWMLDDVGNVYPFGNALSAPSPTLPPSTLATHIEPTPDGAGYWVVDDLGHVFTGGTAGFFGGTPPLGDAEIVTSMSATSDGQGYWLFTNKGRAFPYGDAKFFGDMSGVQLNAPVIDSIRTPSGNGYYMVAQDGGIFTFGDAVFQGSTGNLRLNAPVVGLAPDKASGGYWLVASDGGIFSFGGAAFHGSLGGQRLNKPIIGMVAYGNGYLMVASDGGIFDYSDQPFVGSLGANPPPFPIIGVAIVGG